ncbi:MAG TPA: hypothetical protein VFV85_00805, partial [Conexibacter sp.]|nr:hypothetical protein [Conexibacter sp.]
MRSRRLVRQALGARLAVLSLALLGLLFGAASASADPIFRLDEAADSTVAPGGTLDYFVKVNSVGSDAIGSGFTLRVTLPSGMTSASVTGTSGFGFDLYTCTGTTGATVVICTSPFGLPPLGHTESDIQVNVDPNASGTLSAKFEVSGGGAATQTQIESTHVTAAAPPFDIHNFDGDVDADAGRDPFTQAGGHPYAASTTIDFNTVDNPNPFFGPLYPVEQTKDVSVDLPAGFVGNPNAATQCTASELANAISPLEVRPLCSPSSQVGTTILYVNNVIGLNKIVGPAAVYNMVPPPGVPARFGFNVAGTVVTLDARVRSDGDYGLTVDAHDIPEGLALAGTTLTFWGVPADPRHDAERQCGGGIAPVDGGPTCAAGIDPQAFLRNPTSCTAPVGSPVTDGLRTLIHADSWVHPGRFNADGTPDLTDPNWKNSQFISHLPPVYPAAGVDQLPTGCEKVPFNPALSAQPSAPAQASSPAGFDFELSLPQSDDPDAIGEADLKKAVVTLPVGVRVSPASANGLGACSLDQIGLRSLADPTCPDTSKVGSLTITTPLLRDPLQGSIYLATPNNNPFNSLLAIYLVARGPGVIIKLPGQVSTDPNTGQLTATFDNNPQLPFTRLHLEFKGGARAPLVTPSTCTQADGRPFVTHAELTSWSGKTVSDEDSFALTTDANGNPCQPHGFSPGFSAGTQNPVAGTDSSFVLQLTRGDLDQEFDSLTVDMPTGLLGRIKNATLCSDAAAAAGTCGDASKIGDVVVGAGAGANPFYITNGRAYITGPYKGGPYGLSIVVPAVAGPFDLGNVVVRSAIFVDHRSAQLRIVSDQLPTILQGIPLEVRDIRVLINKPHFMLNPTSCAVKKVDGTIRSTANATADVASRFQVGDCASLALKPKLTIHVGSKGHTGVRHSTPLTTVLTQTPGQSNLSTVRVRLPTVLDARLGVVERSCSVTEYQAGHCEKARAGTATAVTPLLASPLRGGVYFVRVARRGLPDLMVALRGQVSLDLDGKVTIPQSKYLATTFHDIPDAAITKFTLSLVSGSHGPIGVVTNLCSAKA